MSRTVGNASIWIALLASSLVPSSAGAAQVADPCPPEGAGAAGWCGDGGPAAAARLAGPYGVAATADGGFLIADTGNNVVRRVSPRGIITRIAGIGLRGHTGDGGPATAARLEDPTCVAEAPDGAVVVQEAAAVRRITPAGTITTVAGLTACAPAQLPGGDVLVADDAASQIVRIAPNGARTVVAGTGQCGALGDGGPATDAQLALPRGVAALPDGGFLIADSANNLIRRVAPDGTIVTVAGREPPLLACGASPEIDPPNYLLLARPLRARAGRAIRVAVTSTNSGRLTLTITRGRRVFGPVRRRAREGVLRLTIRPRLRRGRYTMTVTNRGRRAAIGGEVRDFRKTDRATLTITR